MSDDLVVRCDCGRSARGPEDELVPKIRQHARQAHGLEVTRERALEPTRPADPD